MGSVINRKLGLDLGTGKTVLWSSGGIIYNAPTMVIVEPGGNRVMFTGTQAGERWGKMKTGGVLLLPVKRGAVADYAATVFLLRKVLSAAMRTKVLKPVIVAGTPIRLSSVESRALCDAAREAGAGGILLVPCNLASMWGITDRPDEPSGSLIVDIGAGATDISVVASNEIVVGRTIPLGGEDLTSLLQRAMEVSYGVHMGHSEAERLKMDVGVNYYGGECVEKVRSEPGRDAAFSRVAIPRRQIAEFLLHGIEPLYAGIFQTLEETPPELFEDIFTKGVMLAGGGSMLPGLGERLKERLNLNINRLPDPSLSVIRGIGKVIGRFQLYRDYFSRRQAV